METNPRVQALEKWLQTHIDAEYTMHPLVADASMRRYYRIITAEQRIIAMDAPPEHENCHAFVAIANALRQVGVQTPRVLAEDVSQGFLLLSDFGDRTYLSSLKLNNAKELYLPALMALSQMQAVHEIPGHTLKPFTREFMLQEWQWHKDWFLKQFLKCSYQGVEPTLDACLEHVVETIAAQPYVFMHRDYHSANLMVLPDGQVGVLDFQDAFIGPVTYDVVSLLRDCYIAWPDQLVIELVAEYYVMLRQQGLLANTSLEEFITWFDYMGIQRHLKALLTFARKYVRDNQAQYLQHIPRTLQYIVTISAKYPRLAELNRYYEEIILPLCLKELDQCVP